MYWKYDNIWNSKWSVFDSGGINVKCAGSSTKGLIDSNTNDALVLLSSLFITNYYWQITVAVMVATFVPIFTAMSN